MRSHYRYDAGNPGSPWTNRRSQSLRMFARCFLSTAFFVNHRGLGASGRPCCVVRAVRALVAIEGKRLTYRPVGEEKALAS
jgi:hypothetical protein